MTRRIIIVAAALLAGCAPTQITPEQMPARDAALAAPATPYSTDELPDQATMNEHKARNREAAAVARAPQAGQADAQRFPKILARLTDEGMSPAEKVVVKQCKQQAEALYNTSVAAYPPGSYQPDMIAIGRLRDCMIANAPDR